MRSRTFILSTLLLVVVFRLVSGEPRKSGYRYISVKELNQRLKAEQPVIVADVRSAYAYQMEHIKGSISLPLQEMKAALGLRPLSRNGYIVTYCSCPHHLAEMASDLFKGLGYSNVLVLDEGLPGWKKEGYPLEGSLANQPVSIFWVVGYVRSRSNKPQPGVEVRLFHPRTQQLEFAKTGKDGFFAVPLRFYGLLPGDQLQASFIRKNGKDDVFFALGPKTEPWGTRIDDIASHVVLLPDQFSKLFRKKKLHALVDRGGWKGV